MKKISILAIVLLSFLAGNGSAQEKFDIYNSAYFKKGYAIDISRKEEKFTFYIETATLDKLSSKASLMIKSTELADFISFIKGVQETYVKWKATAEENKVTELDKSIDSKKYNTEAAFLYGSKWNFDFNCQLTAKVKILNGSMLLIIKSDKLESSSNQFMTNDGIFLVFSSKEEIDEFIGKLDAEKAKKVTEEKKKSEELFKE